MEPTFFASASEFRRWLRHHHGTATELWGGFYKKGSGRPSITWPESVDEALCVGWIDGLRKSLGADAYMIRFTPRKPGSNWSTVNTKRAEELTEAGRMRPAGLRAFEARDPKKSGVYSFEQRKQAELTPEGLDRFKRHAAAWRFFESQPPGYRRIVVFWVMSAKQEATRTRRLDTLIADSAAGRRIAMMRRLAASGARPRT